MELLSVIESNLGYFLAAGSVDFVGESRVTCVQVGLVACHQMVAHIQFRYVFREPNL